MSLTAGSGVCAGLMSAQWSDMSDLPASTSVEHAIVGLVDQVGNQLGDYENDRERLFAVMVCSLDLYVRAVMLSRDEYEASLGDLAVDAAVFDDPSRLADFEATQREAWIEMTARALVENLVE